MSYPRPDPIPNPNNFNYSFFSNLEGYLTLGEADKRYIRKGSSGDFLTQQQADLRYLQLTDARINYLTGITNGVGEANKALILDSSRNINNINNLSAQNINAIGDINTNAILRINRTSNGQTFNSTNGTTSCVLYHFLNGDMYLGSSTSTGNFILQTNNTGRLTINSTGNVSIANVLSGYQLDLGGAGTGINTGSLKFNDVTFNQNLYLNITSGSVEANKALVPNSDLDLGTFRNITMNGTLTTSLLKINNISNTLLTNSTNSSSYGLYLHSVLASSNGLYSGTSIAFNNSSTNDVPLANICLDKINSGRGELIIGSRNGSTCDERLRISDTGLNLSGNIDFHSKSLLYKTVLRPSTISLSDGIEIYDTQFSTNSVPNINFRNDNNSSPIFMEMCGWLNSNRTTATANGQPFQILYRDGVGFTSGLHITCMNTTQALNTNYNVCLSARAGTIPHVVVNDRFNQLHLFPQGLLELNTSYSQNVIIGEELLVRKSLQIGTSQDTGRLISALDSTMSTGTSRFICLGQNNTSRNQAEISFFYDGNNSTSNRLDFGFFGGALMYLTAGGRLGLGTSAPSCGLDVATGENSVLLTNNIAVNSLSYQISSNTWTNFGGGPFSANICARFRGSVWIQDRLWATSDRRLKTDINTLNFSLEHYNQLNPVSFKWKNQDKITLGVIAQEVKKVCAESINLVENPNMTKEADDDIEGFQLTVDYNCINIMNVVAIKKLIEQNKKLESRLIQQEQININLQSKLEAIENRINNLENNNS